MFVCACAGVTRKSPVWFGRLDGLASLDFVRQRSDLSNSVIVFGRSLGMFSYLYCDFMSRHVLLLQALPWPLLPFSNT